VTTSSYLRVALVLPPVQSFFMPYSAPAMLSAAIKERYGVHTLVVDAGIDWLWSELASRGSDGDGAAALAALQQAETYNDIFALRGAFAAADRALNEICQPWAPERVHLSGRYDPPGDYPSWAAVTQSLDKTKQSIFDRYFRHELIPQLRRFRAQIIGLSVPFDWMLWPAMRLIRWLRRSCPDVQIIVGGHAIHRLWHEANRDFFDVAGAHWAAVGDGERALGDLIEYISRGVEPPAEGPLIRLSPRHPRSDPPVKAPQFFTSGAAPDFSDLDLRRYLRPQPILPVPASEGCFYGQCRFCSRQRSDQAIPYVERSPADVADIMRQLARRTGARQFILTGDIFTHRFLLSLARALESEQDDIQWFCEASFKSSMAGKLSLEDCRLLHRGGCRLILNGLESGSARIRGMMGCPVREEAYDHTLSCLTTAGVVPYITLVFGYPGETAEDLMETIRYVKKHLDRAVFATSRFEVVPGTPLSEELRGREGAIFRPRGALQGGFEYECADTLGPQEAGAMLRREIGGMLGAFPEFMRHIPVMMQLLDKQPETGVQQCPSMS